MTKLFRHLILSLIMSCSLGFSLPALSAADSGSTPNAININTASADEMADGLSGIGPSKAMAIVSYREANGPFTEVTQLSQVKGIGQATIDRNINRLTTD